MTQTRNKHIDIAKTLAIFLVVMQHAWSMLGLDDPSWGLLCSAYCSVSTLGVNLFIFISGALLLSQKPEPVLEFYSKRLKRLLIPFVTLAMVAYIVSLLMGAYAWWDGTVKMALFNFIPVLLENKINIFHWFVHMLFVLYLFTPLLQRSLQSLTQRETELLLLIWVIGFLLKQYYPEMQLSKYLPSLWTHLGLYITGYYVYHFRTKNKKYLIISIFSFLLLCIINILTYCAIEITRHLATIFLGIICFNLPIFSPSSQSCIGRMTIKFSRYSYTIYLLHILLIRAIYIVTESYFSNIAIGCVPLIVTPLIMIVFYVACTLYDKIKWLPNNLIGIG